MASLASNVSFTASKSFNKQFLWQKSDHGHQKWYIWYLREVANGHLELPPYELVSEVQVRSLTTFQLVSHCLPTA